MTDRRQVVVCAAVRTKGGHIILGARHYDTRMRETIKKIIETPTEVTNIAMHMHGQSSQEPDNWYTAEQGFIDQWGTFLTRTEAWKIAEAANQIAFQVGGDTIDGGTLYSENLY